MSNGWIEADQLKVMARHLSGAIASILVFSAAHPCLSWLHCRGWIEDWAFTAAGYIGGAMLIFTLAFLSLVFMYELIKGVTTKGKV